MDLANTFTVSLPIEQAWRTLTNLERVAPCMPGATITGIEGDDHHWAVKVKVGPISSTYAGVARFLERDDGAHHAVIQAKGRDAGGQGNVAATVTATLTAQGEGTLVRIDTDLAMSGRVAQFGRGVIADVSGKMFDEFAQRLEREVGADAGPSPSRDGSTAGAQDDAIDLGGIGRAALPALARQVAPVLAGVIIAVVLSALARLVRRSPPRATHAPWPGWDPYAFPYPPPPPPAPER